MTFKITNAMFNKAQASFEAAIEKRADELGVDSVEVAERFIQELNEIESRNENPPSDQSARISYYLNSLSDPLVKAGMASNPNISDIANGYANSQLMKTLERLAQKHKIDASGEDIFVYLVVAANT